MEKSQSLSFSGRGEKKVFEPSRNLSLKNIKINDEEEIREGEGQDGTNGKKEEEKKEEDQRPNVQAIFETIDSFLSSIKDGSSSDLQEIPNSTIEELANLVQKEMGRREEAPQEEVSDFPFLDAIGRISRLTVYLEASTSDESQTMSQANAILQKSMAFLEEEFRSLLEDSQPLTKHDACQWTPNASSLVVEGTDDQCMKPVYLQEVVNRLRMIAGVMISAGYETECCQVFSIARRAALTSVLSELGFERTSADELHKMTWETMEGKISTWTTTFKHVVSISFPEERRLCDEVFAGHPAVATGLFSNLTRSIIIQLLNFVEAAVGTKRSGEKLFKFLDMYETMRDLMSVLDSLFPDTDFTAESSGDNKQDQEEDGSLPSSLLQAELKSEMLAAKSRLSDAVVGIFTDLEISIKSEVGKTPVPGGAIHPLTRYVLNYLKYACEYKNTLEQAFQEHNRSDTNVEDNQNSFDGHQGNSPFAAELMTIMDLLDANIENKAKLYKDPSLNHIFLMNNGRYIVQKLRGWPEINELLGDTWCRKRSSDLRQHHKNYQRETWAKVLGCFKEEGLQQKGAIAKPVLKERFKAFNAMFEEIHKTQSGWVVSDEQLQSELRVSLSAVVIPAYRSFLGRYRHYLDAGRQAEKYIKYAPEDLEGYIDELFEGNPSSMIKRRT